MSEIPVQPTLPQALERVRQHAAACEWQAAEFLCRQLFEGLPDRLLYPAASHWIDVLRGQQRHAEACNVLHMYLSRLPWTRPVGEQPEARVLLLYGLDSVARGDVLFYGQPWKGLSFAVNAGHFDSASLLRNADFSVDRLFLPSQLTPAQQQSLRERLQHYGIIINTIADPASEGPALELAVTLLEGMDNVLNPPQRVLETRRNQVADRLRGLPGLCVPRLQCLPRTARDALHDILDHCRAGLIMRPVNSQTGIGMQRVLDPVAMDAWLDAQPDEQVYAIDYHDFRERNGLFRKYRMFAIGGRLLPEHMIATRQWNVHSCDRYPLMDETPQLRDAEAAFLADPASVIGQQGLRTLQAVAEHMGLDYLGIDFALLPGGDLLLFESNPAMRLNYDHCAHFPYLQPWLDAVGHAFCAMVRERLPLEAAL